MKFLTENLKIEIKEWAKKHIPFESGGIIYIDNTEELKAFNCPNISENPKDHFLISHHYLETVKKLGKIVAYWHSHPDGGSDFSVGDKYIAEHFNMSSILYCVKDDLFLEYEPIGLELTYEGRPYYRGLLDCVKLALDFYQKEYNISIEITNHPLVDVPPSEWHKLVDQEKDSFFLKKSFCDRGFIEIQELEEGALLLFIVGRLNMPSHCGIYLGDNKFLHHSYGRLSEITLLTPSWKRRIAHILKHKLN